MVVTLIASALTYLAFVMFFQAGERRSQFAGISSSASRQSVVRYGAWALLAFALALFSLPQGFVRGIPIWLGVVSCAGGRAT